MTVHSPPPSDLHEPPPPIPRVLLVGLTGVGLVLTSLVFGLAAGAPRQGFDTHWADGPRVVLSCLGLLLAGCAVSMRPGWYGSWLCLAGAGILGYGAGGPPPAGTEWYLAPPRDWVAGMPNSWDSVQLFFGVLGAAGLVGAIATRVPRKVVYSLALVAVAYHFAGILSAITSPDPQPWLTGQYWRRVSRTYLQFAYMNNAYQFYSPEPGPACEMWVCMEYAAVPGSGGGKECDWLYIPRRRTHYNDPLGLTYYRHLSITENIAQYTRAYTPLAAEAEHINRRRASEDDRIPRYGLNEVQRMVPNDLVARQIMPSYIRHLAKAYGRSDRELTGIKVYRTTHTIVGVPQFYGYDATLDKKIPGMSPYSPTLYMPYYQGEFDVHGHLKDPIAPLLYWYIPIIPQEGRQPPESPEEYRKYGFDRYYIDFVSIHAGCKRPQE
ncbi:MAG TPA: hypothetical protein VKD90_08710 [Gemmataceae bacterium]|nr:hypothetical protein [Gemmataceae bacterium]